MMEPKKRGRWNAGESGNPKGRTPGTGEVARLRAAISDRVPEIIEALLQRALAGDVGAARLLLERAVAPLKPSEQAHAVPIPDGTLTDQGRAVLSAVASGLLAPGSGAQLIAAIGTLAKVTEFDELSARVTALENSRAQS